MVRGPLTIWSMWLHLGEVPLAVSLSLSVVSQTHRKPQWYEAHPPEGVAVAGGSCSLYSISGGTLRLPLWFRFAGPAVWLCGELPVAMARGLLSRGGGCAWWLMFFEQCVGSTLRLPLWFRFAGAAVWLCGELPVAMVRGVLELLR